MLVAQKNRHNEHPKDMFELMDKKIITIQFYTQKSYTSRPYGLIIDQRPFFLCACSEGSGLSLRCTGLSEHSLVIYGISPRIS